MANPARLGPMDAAYIHERNDCVCLHACHSTASGGSVSEALLRSRAGACVWIASMLFLHHEEWSVGFSSP